MYVGDDTRTMSFVLREILHIHTQKLPEPSTTTAPGTLYRFTASPLACMLKEKTVTDSSGVTSTDYYTNTLGITASRWREIRYVGTRVQFVPLATTGRVDPADITQSASGVPRSTDSGGVDYSPQGSIHPYDALNFIHWRRWTGGNFNVPKWDSEASTGDEAYVPKCLAYDQEWLADDRFNHAKLTDGMQFDSVPLRVDIETSALAGNSLFGFYDTHSLSADRYANFSVRTANTGELAEAAANKEPIGNTTPTVQSPHNYLYEANLDAWLQPSGLMMPSAGNNYHEEGWLPNPFAGFKYTPSATYTPGDEDWKISGFWPQFPWFADRPDLSTHSYSFLLGNDRSQTITRYAATLPIDLKYLIELCMERFLNPVAIVRLPPAYGSMFFWTVYMAHVFALRKPFLTNSAWEVGRVEAMNATPSQVATLAGENVVSPELKVIGQEPVLQVISADPYGLCESPAVLSIADIAPHYRPHMEPWRIENGKASSDSTVEEPSRQDDKV